ncbi:MAG: nucleoside 2-deoxyribosyltransferase [Nanoarchaeota archaeon]
MLVYIAGPLCTKKERDFVEKLNKVCRNLGFKTFLPHRDVGLVAFKSDIPKAFKEDVNALKKCNLVVASLNGWRIGAGTSWELGYAYAKKKKVIGIKTDKAPEKAIADLSAMILGSMYICTSIKELKGKLSEFKKIGRFNQMALWT